MIARLVIVVWIVVPKAGLGNENGQASMNKAEAIDNDSMNVRETNQSPLQASKHGIHHPSLPHEIIRFKCFTFAMRKKHLNTGECTEKTTKHTSYP